MVSNGFLAILVIHVAWCSHVFLQPRQGWGREASSIPAGVDDIHAHYSVETLGSEHFNSTSSDILPRDA